MNEDQDRDNSVAGGRRRFVIQHHRSSGGEHWDLMLEAGQVLQTWQLSGAPEELVAGPVAAHKVFDHRKLYLTYEGPISRGRGTVRIAERGTYRLLEHREGLIRLELSGERLGGRFELSRREAGTDEWIFSGAADG